MLAPNDDTGSNRRRRRHQVILGIFLLILLILFHKDILNLFNLSLPNGTIVKLAYYHQRKRAIFISKSKWKIMIKGRMKTHSSCPYLESWKKRGPPRFAMKASRKLVEDNHVLLI